MGVTKRDFKSTAMIVSQVGDRQIREYLIRMFSKVFLSSNPQFDVRRFERACVHHPPQYNAGGKEEYGRKTKKAVRVVHGDIGR